MKIDENVSFVAEHDCLHFLFAISQQNLLTRLDGGL